MIRESVAYNGYHGGILMRYDLLLRVDGVESRLCSSARIKPDRSDLEEARKIAQQQLGAMMPPGCVVLGLPPLPKQPYWVKSGLAPVVS